MHTLFMTCLILLLVFSVAGIGFTAHYVLERFAVPFPIYLSTAIAFLLFWAIMNGVVYGVTHA